MSLSSSAFLNVDTIVSTWTSKYRYHISLLESTPELVKLMVEFSLTMPEKPVPIATVRVYFTCTGQQQNNITFRFEKDSLIHSVDKTIRHKEIEKWIDDNLQKKLLVRKTVFYLGTSYEQTRVKDQRLEELLKEPEVLVEPEVCFIDPELLSDQRRFIDIMEKPKKDNQSLVEDLKVNFREIDTENIGVVTRPEFLQIIKNVGLKLSEEEEKEMLNRADPECTGTVIYDKYEEIVKEVLEAKRARVEAEDLLEIRKEEEMFATILAFVNDDIYGIEEELLEHFKKGEDEDDDGLTNISEVKNALDKINARFRESSRPEPLSPIEMSDVTNTLQTVYESIKKIPYKNIYQHIIDLKIKNFSQGLIESKKNRLEVYLLEICDQYDEKGEIKVSNLIKALNECEKIKLTRAQIYLLQSIIQPNSNGKITYSKHTKFLAEVIKKFYLHSSKAKK